MSTIAPSSSVQADSTTGLPVEQKSTGGAAHVYLPAGTNNIGDVDILSIAAGDNNIGNVDVVTLPAPLGTGIMVAASVDVNTAIAADVDAAVAAQAGLRLVGFAARESAGVAAVATFIIVHGATGAAGTAVVPVELAADGSTREWFGPDGIACPNGISIDWIAGTVDVHLFYKVVA